MVSVGFAITFGIMKIANLAHGALYLVGGWVGVTVTDLSGNFVLAIVAGGIAMGVLGLIIERGLLQYVGEREAPQVLLTIGVAFILTDLILIIWGGDPGRVSLPDFLSGGMSVFGVTYPRFRLALLVIAVGFGVLLYWLQYRPTMNHTVIDGSKSQLQTSS